MPERPKAAKDGQQPLQDPRVLAVSRNKLGPAAAPAKPAGTAATAGETVSPPSSPRRAAKENDGKTGLVTAKPQVDSAGHLSQYREQLARDMQKQGLKTLPAHSPAQALSKTSPTFDEAATPSPTQLASGPSTSSTDASTESGQTIRGAITPGLVPKTPSYPFPRMTSGYVPSSLHRPFTTLSPTGSAPDSPASSAAASAMFATSRVQDRILSNPSTPASAMTFRPTAASTLGDNPDYPTPSLYELSLMLSSEPGLAAWWRTVVCIMTELYKAERLTLSVPADSTDLENVPWGQKATYNARQEDGFSMDYMARGSSAMPSSTEDAVSAAGDDAAKLQSPLRPTMSSRHSYTAFEDEKQKDIAASKPLPFARRPNLFPRSKSFYPEAAANEQREGLNERLLQELDAEEEPFTEWDVPPQEEENSGRVFEMLQALDYEADPLIDHHGVARVLERGRVIALTRSYPYLDEGPQGGKGKGRSSSPEGPRKRGNRARHESSTKLSNILSSAHSMKLHAHDRRSGQQNIDQMISESEPRRPPTPSYEEFEQAPPSPWSQSPAPSPAIRSDPKDNPFFTDAMVDESSFDPNTTTPDYTAIGPQEAIGVDNAWTVLHIPLTHPVLSKASTGFRLDPKLMEQKSARRGKEAPMETEKPLERDPLKKEKQTPIAILSVLSPAIPYPSNLRHSLEFLAPHLATTFSLCRHYSTLETEVTRMHHRRPHVAGFGAVDPDGRPITDPAILSYAASEEVADHSLAGSITSPSEYSTQSRSAAGTPGGTPGWEASGFGLMSDKRPAVSSPAPTGGDSYFTTKSKSIIKNEVPTPQPRARRSSKGSSMSEKRASFRLSEVSDAGLLSHDVNEAVANAEEVPGTSSDDVILANAPKRVANRDATTDAREEKGVVDTKGARSTAPHRHTKLHSYGGDLAATFQSMPLGSKFPAKGAPTKTDSASTTAQEVAPTEKLSELILNTLPAQLFVATRAAGSIVWVNSRYMGYRGQSMDSLHADPYASIHPDDRESYLSAWGRAVRAGENFQMNVRIRRFDGAYRCFSARVVACRNRRNEVVWFLGSYTDIHEQTMAELKVVRQQEIEASEAKHRLLANLIPQIIFTATEDEGITFSNEQWLSYTGQNEEDALGIGFMDYVHPDDLANCHIPPTSKPSTPLPGKTKQGGKADNHVSWAPDTPGDAPRRASDYNPRGPRQVFSRNNSPSSDYLSGLPTANLSELAKKGFVKVGRDSGGRLTYTTEIRLRSKTGEYRWHLVRCVEIDNMSMGHGASSYFGSATDINDHKLLEAKLKEAMESKSRFLSNMSHEIRTPLIGISGMVSFLQDTTLNEEQRDYTNTIQTSANSLLMIINDILDLSKVDAGMMKLNYEWFHTRALIEDVNELVSAMAIARRLELNYIVDEEVPTWIKGDRVRIRQVLLNVIGNAIKFTESGEVFSRCRVKTGVSGLGEQQVMLEFAVIDTGRGFTEEERKLIFKPFSQIDGSSTRAHGGSGLGLVISRQLVELHGGKMEGTAVPGKGATFTFTAKFGLPTEDDHPDGPASPPVTATPAAIEEIPTQPFKQFTITRPRRVPSNTSPSATDQEASPAVASSGSSIPSIASTGTRVTERSSISSVNVGLARFSEAARASGQDLSQMKLEMPPSRPSPARTPTPDQSRTATDFHPPMFSILVICPQTYSREATARHIEMTLPKGVPHQLTTLGSAKEAEQLIGQDDPVIFTHIIVNLPSADDIVHLMEIIRNSTVATKTKVVLLSDSIQRQDLTKLVAGTSQDDLVADDKITYVYKPVKPSRLSVIFDPARVGDLSVDRNRSTAERIVEDQKKSYQEVEKRMGNKGYKVLLVEDNPVNQKVLNKYLVKVGLEVDLATDGEECTTKVFSHPQGFYSLILVSRGAVLAIELLSHILTRQ